MREEFEKLPEIAELLIEAVFDADTGEYVSYWAYKSGYLNGAWYAFQEQKKKIESAKKEINDFFDNQTMTPSPREYANKLADLLEILK